MCQGKKEGKVKTKLLSTRIRDRIAHCYDCGGTGYTRRYVVNRRGKAQPMQVMCNECADWNVTLRGVLKLERELRKARSVRCQTR